MNIYVGNLPRTVNEDEVRNLFSEFGEVTEVKLIRDRQTGELRGFGFVEMPSKEDGTNAIKEVDGTEIGGRTIIVNEARPRKEHTGGRRRGGGGGFHNSRSRSW